MHRATIDFMNRSMRLVNSGECDMDKTCYIRLPTGFSLLSGSKGKGDSADSGRLIPFVTPQLADQTIEGNLYVLHGDHGRVALS